MRWVLQRVTHLILDSREQVGKQLSSRDLMLAESLCPVSILLPGELRRPFVGMGLLQQE